MWISSETDPEELRRMALRALVIAGGKFHPGVSDACVGFAVALHEQARAIERVRTLGAQSSSRVKRYRPIVEAA
jgi:hypothetical protein